ncbi:amidase [Acetobacter sp.]|uniref:amidase n=1 Tax=Acetobacter sp. TaxID=440 RepID=UPI0039E910D7
MTPHEYAAYSAVELAALVRARQVTPEEVLNCALRRARDLDPTLNAIAHWLDDDARSSLPHVPLDAPFAGVPFLVKDTGAGVRGAPMTSGSRLMAGFCSPADTTLVSRYRAAGLMIFGKTNTPEFGLSFTTEPLAQGATRNPWNLSYSPGGSSGGSAAAVAAGIVPVAHGSDGAGSIRLPASHCHLFGYKPSRGLMPFGPVQGEGLAGVSGVHALSRTVLDSACLLDVSCGAEIGDPYASPLMNGSFATASQRDPEKPLRIGFSVRTPFNDAVDPACERAVMDAARLCEDLGHHVEEASFSGDAQAIKDSWLVIVSTAALHSIRRREAQLSVVPGSRLEPVNAAWMAWASTLSARDFYAAFDIARITGRQLGQTFTRYDVLLTPTAATPPPPLGELACIDNDCMAFYDRFWGHGPFTGLYNLTGCPAMSVPFHIASDNRPVGVHFGAALGADMTLMALAGQLERSRPWHYRCYGMENAA